VRFPLSGSRSPRHLAAVRVPIPVVIFLVLAVAGGAWWGNTRHMDFVTPPSEAKLAETRVKIESSLPRTDLVDDAISVPATAPPPPPVEPPKPVVELGDLTIPPSLQDYRVRSKEGSAHLIELATLLEEKEEFQRALLAWERVIDLTHPDEGQAANAISAIKRLRPTLPDWNAKPETAITLSLRAGTAKNGAKTLTSTLEGVARDLERASSGIVKIKTTVTAGKISSITQGPAPVAIWLAGPEKKSVSTEVRSFTTDSPDTLRDDILKTVFLLIQSHLGRATAYTPPAGLAAGESPQDALNFRVTRLCWSEFATTLNQPPKKTAAPRKRF
jgi:hypothetical protein